MTANIAARLAERAQEHPAKAAVIEHDRQCTFGELEARVERLACGLERAGIARGVKAALMVRPSIEFFALTFALFRAGAVPVMVDPGMGRQHIGTCLREAAPRAFIGIPLAHLARSLMGWAKDSVETLVTVGFTWWWGGETLESLAAGNPRPDHPAVDAGDVAAILFTSGSTGVPKGAVYTHRIFSTQVDMLIRDFGMGPADVDVPTFPLFALFDAALGATAVIPRMDFTRPAQVDPREIVGCVKRNAATQMFGSPALLDRVGSHGVAVREKLPTLRRVITAGAPVPPKALAKFATMLAPDARIYTPYGATEALPVAAIAHPEILGETAALSALGQGTCVGRPLPGLDVRVIKISDAAIARWSDDLLAAPGEVGEIVVRGPIATGEYYARPEATALAKIPADGSFYHRMGDLGRQDAQGRIWFCGRKSHRVITPAGTLFTIPCEAIFNQHPRVKRTALVGIGAAGHQRPVICVELERGKRGAQPDHATIKRELLALGAAHAHTAGIREVLFHESFPVDVRHNSKIFREKLADWAAGLA